MDDPACPEGCRLDEPFVTCEHGYRYIKRLDYTITDESQPPSPFTV